MKNNADVDQQNANGRTALMYAAGLGLIAKVNQLIEGGANINIVDGFGKTALDYAHAKQHTVVVQALEDARKLEDAQDSRRANSRGGPSIFEDGWNIVTAKDQDDEEWEIVKEDDSPAPSCKYNNLLTILILIKFKLFIFLFI